MSTVTVEEAQAMLPALLEKLTPGEAVVITRDGKPVGCLTQHLPVGRPILGRGIGKLTIVSDDDDDIAQMFAESK
jgi:antitoxin (DNA-binding transcriptional repressor) of toxin-antitoxin stability system